MPALTLSASAALASATPSQEEVVLRDYLSPAYNRTEYETACGSANLRIRYRNGPAPGGHGRVEHVLVDGRRVLRAAEQLESRAARRVIVRIGIMNCGLDAGDPLFRGVMEVAPAPRLRAPTTIYFRLIRRREGGWQLVLD